MSYKAVLITFSVLFFANAALLNAQSEGDIFHHLTTRDGLTNTFVWEMHQDRHGFIWVAGISGVDRFDGYSLTNFKNDISNENSISAGSVFAIFEDDDEFLWFGSFNGISVYLPSENKFKRIRVPEGDRQPMGVRDFLKKDDGSLWVAGFDGIYRFSHPDFRQDSLKAEFFEIKLDTTAEYGATKLIIADDQSLWVGSNRGLLRFDLATGEFSQAGPFNSDADSVLSVAVWDMLRDSRNDIWITTERGLVHWRDGDPSPRAVTTLGEGSPDLTNQFMQAITETKNGQLWFGTGLIGAIRFDPATGTVLNIRANQNNPNSLSEDDVHYAFEDADDNVWFGYHNFGISYMYSQSWEYSFLLVDDDLSRTHPLNYVHSVKEDELGNLWLATHQGLVKKPADGGVFRNFIPDQSVASNANVNQIDFIQIVGNSIIFSTHSTRIYHFDSVSEVFTLLDISSDLGASVQFFSYTDTHFVLASYTRNLILINRSDLSVEILAAPARELDSFSTKPVHPVSDVAGDVYLINYFVNVSFNGIDWEYLKLDLKNRTLNPTSYVPPEDTPVQFAPPTVAGFEPGVFWTAHSTGIIREDIINGTHQWYFQSEAGVILESAKLMMHDNNGHLWLGSRTGITKLNPATEVISYYDADITRKPPIFYEPVQLKSGEIIFSGSGGYIRFDPATLETDPDISNIHVTELWFSNSVINILGDENSRYRIDYANNNISFSYIGLNYRNPASTRYRYRLSGYDENWNEVGTQRRVFLANLSPGDYTFQVQAAQRFGQFGDTMAEVRITILPPWYRTLPAYILYGVFLVGGFVTIDRVQRRRLLLQERERTREKELAQAKEIEKAYQELKAAQTQLVQQEKLASLGQLTAGIAHEIKNPLNFVNNFSSVSVELVDEALEEIRKGEAGHGAQSTEHDSSAISEILNDIKSNLQKIHEHGTRADKIVKGMLMHSRGKSGDFQDIDLNDLVSEYVNLAYHGMRATDASFRVDINTKLDPAVGKINVVPQDLSRAILNIVNNACYAVNEKNKSGKAPAGYKPMVTVSTKSEKDGVVIKVHDNGSGIPESVKKRIFEPFFTTKPPGEGTGLGLSMTYDTIVHTLGGKLEIETKDGEFTEFKIHLPRRVSAGVND